MAESIKVTNDLFGRMLAAAVKQGKADPKLQDEWIHIALDPGETTGISWYFPWDRQEGFKIHMDQILTPNLEEGADVLFAKLDAIAREMPTLVTVEDYKVYSWKADTHKFAGLHTPQLIGAIRRHIHEHKWMYHTTRMAQGAKAWATDENLTAWGIYDPGQKHARDACRHLVTTLFFEVAPKLPS